MNSKFLQSSAIDGLCLSLVFIVYSLISSLLSLNSGFISIILWILKFGGTIWLLYYFIKKYSLKQESFTYGAGFKYGFMISLFSTIACVAYILFNLTVLNPDSIEIFKETLFTALESTGNSAALEGYDLDRLISNVYFFWMPVYYLLWGVILAAILANYTKRTDFFAPTKDVDDDI